MTRDIALPTLDYANATTPARGGRSLVWLLLPPLSAVASVAAACYCLWQCFEASDAYLSNIGGWCGTPRLFAAEVAYMTLPAGLAVQWRERVWLRVARTCAVTVTMAWLLLLSIVTRSLTTVLFGI